MQPFFSTKKWNCEHYAANSLFLQNSVGTIEKWTKINVHF